MIEIILKLLELSFWSGIAAVGFGLLFNVPKSSVFTIFILGFGAGFIKFLLIHFNVHVVLGSFLGCRGKISIDTNFFNFVSCFGLFFNICLLGCHFGTRSHN